MIKILVDESFAYDILAVSEIKESRLSCDGTRNNALRISNEIESQVGKDVHSAVLSSVEYRNLKDTNSSLFDIFEEIKSANKCKCYDVQADLLNYKRFECKKALQSKFFPASPITEIKIGYDK